MSCQFKDKCPSYSGWCEGPKQDFSRCIPFLVSAVQNRDAEIKVLKIELEEHKTPVKILYECDRRNCVTCHPECHLTSDIRHAENFQVDQAGYFEEV